MAPRSRNTSAKPTPARRTRSQRQETTPVPEETSDSASVHSTSYGSPGPDSIRQAVDEELAEMPIGGRTFAEALRRQSEKKAANSPSKAAAKSPAKSKPAAKPLFGQSVRDRSNHNDGPAHYFDFRPPSSSLNHEGTSIAPVLDYERRPLPFASTQTHKQPDSVPSTAALREAARPWDITVLYHSLPRYVTNTLDSVFAFVTSRWLFLLLSILLWTPVLQWLPGTPRSLIILHDQVKRGTRVALGYPEFDPLPDRFDAQWHFFAMKHKIFNEPMPKINVPELQWSYNINFLTRIESLEKRTTKLEDSVERLHNIMKEELPMRTVVQIMEGRWIIPHGFWLAFHDKLTGDSTLWEAFKEANEEDLIKLSDKSVANQLAIGQADSTIVSRSQLEDIIRENYDGFLKEFRGGVDNERNLLVNEVRSIASQVAADLIARETAGKIPNSERAANLAGASFLENNLDEIHSINYFSPYHGAQVDYRMTSPTALRKQSNWIAQWYANLGQEPNKPHTALRAWKEVTESWCAAKSDSPGKAQLAVNTQQFVTPTDLIVEHIPRGGTLEISNAPRELELWMHVGEASMVYEVEKVIQDEVPSWERIECGDSPGPGFVCVAKGMYDIHKDNWVQSIPALRVLGDFSVKSQRFIVRAYSNWGGDNTCFYRLRLKGRP